MIEYLNNEYPFYYNLKKAFLIGLIILLLSTLFSVLFEPFDVNFQELKFSYFIVSFIHALVSFVVFMTAVLVLNSFRYKNQVWKVKNEFIFLILVLVTIGIFQFLIRDFIYNKNDNWSFRYLYEEIRNTLLIGGLLILVITSINIERLKQIYEHRVKMFSFVTQNSFIEHSNSVNILTHLKSDDFTLNIEEFIFAKSDKNYIEFYLTENKILLKRMTIKNLEKQLLIFDSLIRTHRSYIVNLNAIVNIKGNAQGYKLILKNNLTAPVSRTMISNFEEKLKVLS